MGGTPDERRGAMSTTCDPSHQPGCGLSSIAAVGGPAAVPFRMCCAYAIIRASGVGRAVVPCAAGEAGTAALTAERRPHTNPARTAP